jgi:hypothetical protein
MPKAFRLTAPQPLERDVHEACAKALDALLLPPARWFAYPAGGTQLAPQQHAALARKGLKRGLPDLWFLYQRVYCIELKRQKGGRLSKTFIARTKHGAMRIYEGQEDVFPALLATGAIADIAICTSVDEVITQLAVWNIPLRRVQ